MEAMATLIRKVYVGHRTRSQYKRLLQELAQHEPKVRTIQRYARGFLVRSRMWREAMRAEEELWAATEMQRIWRGYQGRVIWETKYEAVWSKEIAATKIQRNIRGWLGRCRVGRTRRRIARAEFDRARKRFFAAQRLQALARGVNTRRFTHVRRRRRVWAATEIQRVWRGLQLRLRLWKQIRELRAITIQSWSRGFLVRKRRLHFVAIVICIQHAWRNFRRKPLDLKRRAKAERRERTEKARIIQGRVREQQLQKQLAEVPKADPPTTPDVSQSIDPIAESAPKATVLLPDGTDGGVAASDLTTQMASAATAPTVPTASPHNNATAQSDPKATTPPGTEGASLPNAADATGAVDTAMSTVPYSTDAGATAQIAPKASEPQADVADGADSASHAAATVDDPLATD
jgi:hypothetical protein